MEHASHGEWYGLLNISVVDSFLVEGSFSTDYHNDDTVLSLDAVLKIFKSNNVSL